MTSMLDRLLSPYNPWWTGDERWRGLLPRYERPVVGEILADLRDLPQMVSVTGPRRVGKSTAVRQVITKLIGSGVSPRRILYFSFDDPEVFASQATQRVIFDQLTDRMQGERLGYLFLDEIQRLPRWELFLKKYYDLQAPFKFVVSGSASSPIFRSSQESLLGRIKDRHLLPFSFREFCQLRLLDQASFASALEQCRHFRQVLLAYDTKATMECLARLQEALQPYESDIGQAVWDYANDGGFPEVWDLPDPVRKIEYLMEQQVRKVLYEDLMVLAQYRKPENVLRLFLYLLSNPGAEINITRIARDAGVERRVVEENLPRLEMTDLLLRLRRFSNTPLRVRQGNIKTYPVDMALRNAALKTWNWQQQGGGYLAENLVVRELFTWKEAIEISYYREKNREVDFVVTVGGDRHLPIEVKLGNSVGDLQGLRQFMKRFSVPCGVVISRHGQTRCEDSLLYIPLRLFLLAN